MIRALPRHSAWLFFLGCALGFLIFLHRGWALRVEHLSNLDRAVASAAATADPSRAAVKRWFIAPGHQAQSYQWIAETQQMIADGKWRVHSIAVENAPFGREVHNASPYRWWLVFTAWCDRLVSDRSWNLAVEHAALWADPLLHGLALVAMTVFVARRFGAVAAMGISLGLVALFPFAASFLPGTPDSYGLTQILGLASVLILLGGMSVWKTESQNEHARLAAWFFFGGVIGGVGLWISAGIQGPLLLGLAAGGALAAILRRIDATDDTRDPLPWRWWALGGAVTSLFAYLIEYYPAQMALRLQVNHPLYGVAWLGIGELLAQLARRGSRPTAKRWPDFIRLALAVIALGSLVTVMIQQKSFPVADSLAAHLSNLPDSAVAKNFAMWIHRDGFTREVFVACLPLILLAPALARLVRRQTPAYERSALALAIVPTLVAFFLALAQLRWWSVGQGLLLAPLAVMAARTSRNGRTRTWIAIAGGVLAVGLIRLVPAAEIQGKNEFAPLEVEGLLERDIAHWIADHASATGAVVLAPPARTAEFCFHGGLRGLGTPNWENRDGIAATIRIVSAVSADEAKALLDQRGVTYLVLPSWDTDLDEFARWTVGKPEDSFIHAVHRWALPPWLRPLPYRLPKVAGFENQNVVIFEVTDTTDRAAAVSRLAEYFLEMHQPELAGAASQALLPYPTNLGALVARAGVERTRGNSEEFSRLFNSLVANLSSGLDRNLPWDRRVSLAVLLAQGNRPDLARAQLERCLKTLDEQKIRSLTTESLYRLLVLSKAFDQKIDPRLHAIALQLVPAETRARL